MQEVTTRDELTAYMLGRLSNVGALLGLTQNDLNDAADDALYLLGITDPSEAASGTPQRQLKAAATLYAWDEAAGRLAAYVTFSADGTSYKRSDLVGHAEKAYNRAYDRCIEAGLFNPEVLIIEADYEDGRPYD